VQAQHALVPIKTSSACILCLLMKGVSKSRQWVFCLQNLESKKLKTYIVDKVSRTSKYEGLCESPFFEQRKVARKEIIYSHYIMCECMHKYMFCVCMCVCVFVYLCVHACAHVCAYVHVFVHVCVFVCVSVYLFMYTYIYLIRVQEITCVYPYRYICICICECMQCLCIYLYTCIYTYMYIYLIYVYIYIYV